MVIYCILLALFRMGLFGAAQGWGEDPTPFLKICNTYPTMIKLDTAIQLYFT